MRVWKSLASWFAAAFGCLVGFLGLATLGMEWAPSPQWFGLGGLALLGPSFLLGSLVALRSRRSAGIIFLTVMPVAAFCLAYPDSGFLVFHDDGSGWFETPLLPVAIGLAALFYLPFVAPLLVWRRKKRAAVAFLSAALVAG